MKVLRVFAALVFVLGAGYVVTSVLSLLMMGQTSELLEMGRALPPGGEAEFRRRTILIALALAAVGLPSAVWGVGLFMAKEWARRSWPFIAALVVLAHGAWFILDLNRGGVELWDWLAPAAISFVYAGSAIYLTRPDTKALFRRRRVGAT